METMLMVAIPMQIIRTETIEMGIISTEVMHSVTEAAIMSLLRLWGWVCNVSSFLGALISFVFLIS